MDLQRYAAWKAADIRKALREGRQPTPGNGNAAPDDLLPGVPPHEVGCCCVPLVILSDISAAVYLRSQTLSQHHCSLSGAALHCMADGRHRTRRPGREARQPAASRL